MEGKLLVGLCSLIVTHPYTRGKSAHKKTTLYVGTQILATVTVGFVEAVDLFLLGAQEEKEEEEAPPLQRSTRFVDWQQSKLRRTATLQEVGDMFFAEPRAVAEQLGDQVGFTKQCGEQDTAPQPPVVAKTKP